MKFLVVTVFALPLFACVVTSCAGAERSVLLTPSMPQLEKRATPPLSKVLPDADITQKGLSISPDNPYSWVAAPGDGFRVTIQGPKSADGEHAVFTVWDWELRAVSQHRFPLPFTEGIEFKVAKRGTYLLTLDLFKKEECTARLVRSFSICPSNLERKRIWDSDQFFIGTCAFPGRQHWNNKFGPASPPGLSEQESRELDAELSARLGLVIVRNDLRPSWPGEDASFDFSRVDKAMEAWTSRGFKLYLQIGLPGDWAVKPEYEKVEEPKWRYPKRGGPARKYISECVKRYGPVSEYIELYNEPDNKDFWRGRPEEYIEWARWAIEEIKKEIPNARIAAGGYCMVEPEWTPIIAKALNKELDVVGYHSHGDVLEMKKDLDDIRGIHRSAGYKGTSFINSETGYAAWRLDRERHQGATAIQKIIFCWTHGDRGILLYCSRGVGGPRQRKDDPDYGYIDHFFCPRYLYGSLSAFIDTYTGAIFVRVLAETPQVHAYLFRSKSKLFVTVFTPKDERHTITIDSDALSAEIIDPMGNATEVKARHVQMRASLYPHTLVLDGATDVTYGP